MINGLAKTNDFTVFPTYERTFPPIGFLDTCYLEFNSETGSVHAISVHGTVFIFKDEEITKKEPVILLEKIDRDRLEVRYTKHGKAIIQQQAIRGCTAACAGMLMKDHQKNPTWNSLAYCSLGTNESMQRLMKEGGLSTTIRTVAYDLIALQKAILENGSAIVCIDSEGGAHVVVVDEISFDLNEVRLRDPYHGHEITVTAKAFLDRWKSYDTEILQVL